MSMSNAFENALLLHIYNNSNIANLGDATGLRGSTTAGSVYVALHTADPGEAGDQTTSECAYTGSGGNYARQAVARSAGGWTVSGNTAVNAAVITFPICNTGSSETATHWSTGFSASGASTIINSGALGANLSITPSPATTPEFAAGAIVISAD